MIFESINFNVEYAFIGVAAAILYILYYIFTKDADYNKHIRSVATVVEELNREVFYLKKSLAEIKKSMEQTTTEQDSRGMSDEEIYQEIERSVYDMIQPLTSGLRNLQETIHTIDSQVDTRISSLESGVKQFSIPSSIHANDDQKIISLFKQGVSLETISRELHLSQPEVEFVLKINKIK